MWILNVKYPNYRDNPFSVVAGYYLFAGTTATSRGIYKAVLQSPSYSKAAGACQVTFGYVMRSTVVGSISVKLKLNNGTEVTKWTKSGITGGLWYTQTVTLGGTSQSYKVLILASFTRTSANVFTKYLGEITVDDVRLMDCSPYATATKKITGDCDFDWDLCLWLNALSGDERQWIRTNAKTPSSSTGPTTDHTKATSEGYYLHIETSAPSGPGNKSQLIGPVMVSPPGICRMNFYYHMYGNDIGELNVYVKNVNSGSLSLLWSGVGDRGNRWWRGEMTINVAYSYQIVIDGIDGQDYQGDIAIDDITFTSGCTSKTKLLCSADQFSCSNGNCVPRDVICDYENDCGDGSDEAASNCRKLFLTSTSLSSVTEVT